MIEEDFVNSIVQDTKSVTPEYEMTFNEHPQKQSGFKVVQCRFNDKLDRNQYTLKPEIRIFINKHLLKNNI